MYAHKAKHPTVSPLFDMSTAKLPPAMASLATVDRLLGMDLAYYSRKISEGETVVLDLHEDQFHVFQFLVFLPQTSTCLARMADFAKKVTTDPSSIKTGFHKVAYDGSVAPMDGGVETLKKMLRDLNDRAERIGWNGEAKDVYVKAAA